MNGEPRGWTLLVPMLLLATTSCAPHSSGRDARSGGAAAESAAVISANAGQILALAARGDARATLVNVWATWCAPCRAEFPGMLRAARARQQEGLRLVLVSSDFEDQLPAVRKFLAEQGVHDTTYLKSGDDMSFINQLSPDWSGALPATFVFGADGRLLTHWEGEADTSQFASAMDRALHSTTHKESQR